jgi:hypothetical protein
MTTTRRLVLGMKSPFTPLAHAPNPATDAAAKPRPDRFKKSLRVNRFIGSSPWARIDVFRDPAPA